MNKSEGYFREVLGEAGEAVECVPPPSLLPKQAASLAMKEGAQLLPSTSFPSLPHFQEEEDRPEAQRPTVHYSSPLQGERGALPRFRPAAPRVIYLCAMEVIAVTAPPWRVAAAVGTPLS